MQNQYLINGQPGRVLTPFDRGFAYGDGVFRTMPVLDAGIPHWDLHYRKLREDCSALGIVCPPAEQLFADAALLMPQSGRATLKMIITRGEGARGYAVPSFAQPTRVVMCSEFPDYPRQHVDYGVTLHLCQLRLSHQPRLAGIKHLNRLENVLARMEWHGSQAADGLLLDGTGHVIECTMSNIFLREGHQLVTPELSQCGVAGVTRERILGLAQGLDYQAKAEPVALERLLLADEVVICNSLFGAWQVRHIENRTWPEGALAQLLRTHLET